MEGAGVMGWSADILLMVVISQGPLSVVVVEVLARFLFPQRGL